MFVSRPSDRIDDYLRYHELVLGKGHLANAVGASEEQIARLCAACPYPLPKLYLDWLRVFGRNKYGINPSSDMVFCVDSLIPYYERMRIDDSFDFMAPFAEHWICRGLAFYYQTPGTHERPVVAETVDGEFGSVSAESYQNHLYRELTICGIYPDGHRYLDNNLYGSDRHLMPQVYTIAHELGHQGYWFNDAYHAMFSCGDFVLVASLNMRGTDLHVSSHNVQRLADVTQFLLDRLPLTNLSRR